MSEYHNLEKENGEKFSEYYHRLLKETYNAIGREDMVFSMERFNLIKEGEDNDFDRSINLTKNPDLRVSILNMLGLIMRTIGLREEALVYHERALEIDEQLNNRDRIGADYRKIGIVYQVTGNHEKALSYFEKALAFHERRGMQRGIARDYRHLGIIHRLMGHNEKALELHQKALEIDKQVNRDRDCREELAADYRKIGMLLVNMGRYQDSLEYHQKGLKIDEEIKHMKNLARDYAGVGVAYYKLNNSREALSYHQRALEIDEQLRARPGMAADYRNIGIVLSSDFSKLDAALSSNQKALEIHKELKDVTEMARDYNNIAIVLDLMKRRDEALTAVSEGIKILQEYEEKTGYHHPLIEQLKQTNSNFESDSKSTQLGLSINREDDDLELAGDS
jgi:tetratricopeptide (TPR) repeat protein